MGVEMRKTICIGIHIRIGGAPCCFRGTFGPFLDCHGTARRHSNLRKPENESGVSDAVADGRPGGKIRSQE